MRRLFVLFAVPVIGLALLPSFSAQAQHPIITPWMEEEAEPPPEEDDWHDAKREETRSSRENRQDERYGQQQMPPQPLPYEPVRRTAVPPQPEKPSAIETMYSERIVDELDQFGYDLFGVPREDTRRSLNRIASSPLGAVQDDFVLNSGDELEVVFSGQRTDRDTYSINNDGLLLIEDFPPIPAAGRTIAQVRLSIENAADYLHNTKAYISLASVRQIGVLIVGHVKKPGRQTLTVFHTVLDALMEAGGVQKTGSLRQIKLIRHGRATHIDLYGLLVHGSANMDLRLRDGDRIVVPPIGPTVAVAGEVKRRGIYEILPTLKGMRHNPSSQKLSLNEMLELGGGVLAPGQNRFLRLGLTRDGHEEVEEMDDPFSQRFGDGSILMVSKGQEKRAGTVELLGHTRRAGIHALHQVPTLAKLLDNVQVLGPDAYPLIGVIERWDEDQLTSQLTDFPVLLVLKGDYDRKLHDGDAVHLFSRKQIASLSDHEQNDEQQQKKAKFVPVGSTAALPEEMDDVIEDKVIAAFLRERSTFVRGSVRSPGAYPVARGATLDSVLAVAGGLSLEADTSNIEVTTERDNGGTQRIRVNFHETRPGDVEIAPGASIRVNQKFKKIKDNSVLIIGEVNNPGRYDLLPGDKMSDLMQRAGGLTAQAYPDGAIFSRESERKAEESRFRSAARDLERAAAVAAEKDENGPNPEQLAMARSLAKELRDVEAVGRITVEADPAALSAQPELDMLLEPGDRVFIPKRPLMVRVSGEVLSPASLQFREEKAPINYIDEAGGFTHFADDDRAFVLFPDGSAQPLQVSPWNHKASFIPPGSTIVIPRDPKPFDFLTTFKDMTQILANLATTAIFLDEVRED